MSSSTMFEDSARAFLALVARIGDEQWALPGLGVWDVRGLAGHTSRAITTVETYLLAEEPAARTVPDAVAYYGALAGGRATPEDVARRGVEAGAGLGDDPAATVAEAIHRAIALVAAQPPGRLVAVAGHAIALDEYLRTRVLELVVHTLDLSRATGLTQPLPPEAVEASCALAGALAARAGRGEELLLALTGREQLADGFTVV